MKINTDTLADKILLASVAVKKWSPTRQTAQGIDAVTEATQADAHAVKVYKTLIDTRSPAWRQLVRCESALRTAHYDNTLSWAQAGARLLPRALAPRWQTAVSDYCEAFHAAASSLTRDYPRAIEQARRDLGAMFDESQYPTAEQFREAFSACGTLTDVPRADRLLGLSDSIAETVRRDTKALIEQSAARAANDYADRLRDALSNAVNRLQGDGVFHNTLITNIRELVDRAAAFNLADSAELDGIAARLLSGLATAHPDDLRHSPTARAQAAAQAAAALAQVDDYRATLSAYTGVI
jgi:hypothetical protein